MPRRASIDRVKAAIGAGIKVGRDHIEAKRIEDQKQAKRHQRFLENEKKAKDGYETALYEALSQIPFRKDLKVMKRSGMHETSEYESRNTYMVYCTFVEVGRELNQWNPDRTRPDLAKTNGKEIMFVVDSDGFRLFHVSDKFKLGAAEIGLKEHQKYIDHIAVVRAVAEWAAKRGLLAPSR